MTDPQSLNCIFCRIVAEEIPAERIYEDEHFLVFLDIHPETPGHSQVIPKQHYRWVWDLPSRKQVRNNQPSISDYFEVVKKVAEAQRQIFQTDWIMSKVIGDEVPHAHVWVFPGKAKGDKSDLAGNGKKLRAALKA